MDSEEGNNNQRGGKGPEIGEAADGANADGGARVERSRLRWRSSAVGALLRQGGRPVLDAAPAMADWKALMRASACEHTPHSSASR